MDLNDDDVVPVETLTEMLGLGSDSSTRKWLSRARDKYGLQREPYGEHGATQYRVGDVREVLRQMKGTGNYERH